MDLWTAIIFGIVEGVTEFLPISSTGHLILTAKLLGVDQTLFLKSFEISIQLGAIVSVIILYGKVLLTDVEVIKRVLTAFLPTAGIGFLLYQFIKGSLMGEGVVAWALLMGGIVLIVFEWLHNSDKNAVEDIKGISYGQAFGIGLFQALSVIPGVSRAAATILGGLVLGLKRKTIVEFSFLLAIPTMLTATGFDLMKNASGFSDGQFLFLAMGFLSSFFVALGSIKFLLKFIQTNNFMVFGIYRVVIALLFMFFFR